MASQGEGLNLAISKEEVHVHIGDGECLVKTLTLTHLYCEPPPRVPQPSNGSGTLLQFVVRLGPQAQGWAAGAIRASAQESCASHHPQMQMGNVRLALGPVQYEVEPVLSAFPVEAQVGLGVGAALLITAVLLLTLMYR